MRTVNLAQGKSFFFLKTAKRAGNATTNERKKINMPGIIPSIASSQLVRPSVSVGSSNETKNVPPPSTMPMIPRNNKTFAILDSPLSCDENFSLRMAARIAESGTTDQLI